MLLLFYIPGNFIQLADPRDACDLCKPGMNKSSKRVTDRAKQSFWGGLYILVL